MKIKIIAALTLLFGGFLLFRKKKEPTDKGVENYTPNQLIARKVAAIIKSALSIDGGAWAWTEDEETVIKVLNENYAIQNLIAIEYKKITSNVLMDDLSKYLSAEDLGEINFNRI